MLGHSHRSTTLAIDRAQDLVAVLSAVHHRRQSAVRLEILAAARDSRSSDRWVRSWYESSFPSLRSRIWVHLRVPCSSSFVGDDSELCGLDGGRRGTTAVHEHLSLDIEHWPDPCALYDLILFNAALQCERSEAIVFLTRKECSDSDGVVVSRCHGRRLRDRSAQCARIVCVNPHRSRLKASNAIHADT